MGFDDATRETRAGLHRAPLLHHSIQTADNSIHETGGGLHSFTQEETERQIINLCKEIV